MSFLHHLWPLSEWFGLTCVLKHPLVLFLFYCVVPTKYWGWLICWLFQVFFSLLLLKENLFHSNHIDLSLLFFCQIFSWFNAIVTAYWEQLPSLLFCGFIVAFWLLTHSGESMYDPKSLRLLLTLVIHQHDQIQNRYPS